MFSIFSLLFCIQIFNCPFDFFFYIHVIFFFFDWITIIRNILIALLKLFQACNFMNNCHVVIVCCNCVGSFYLIKLSAYVI